MKKILFLIFSLFIVTALFSCGGKEVADTPETTVADDKNEASSPEETLPLITTAEEAKYYPDLSQYDSYKKFEAPKGNLRDIVYDYMYAMSQVEWVASKSWNSRWKMENGPYKVDLSYEEGKKYYGIPYTDTKCGISFFENYVIDGKLYPNSEFHEELVGNHCSSSMGLAYQQILDFPYSGELKENTAREGIIKLAAPLEMPPSRSNNPYDYVSETVTTHNGEAKIYEAYAALGKGDILYKMIDGYGHTRMVSKVEVSKSVAGKIIPSRSYIYCLEQTNAWADNKRESTWFIDRKYSFEELNSTYFTPFTLCIFHEENPKLYDAYIMMKGQNTETSVKKLLTGTIESTFPLNAVRATVTDADGNVVGEAIKHNFSKTYKVSVRDMSYSLGIDKLPAGSYTFKLQAAIARGSWDIETIPFTID